MGDFQLRCRITQTAHKLWQDGLHVIKIPNYLDKNGMYINEQKLKWSSIVQSKTWRLVNFYIEFKVRILFTLLSLLDIDPSISYPQLFDTVLIHQRLVFSYGFSLEFITRITANRVKSSSIKVIWKKNIKIYLLSTEL